MDRLVEKVRDIGYLADRYDPRYQGPERGEFTDEVLMERAKHMLRNEKVIIGGSHTAPIQAFAIRRCEAAEKQLGRSIIVQVAKLLEQFPTGKEFYEGTNLHNFVTFADVYRVTMAVQPWEERGFFNGT